MDKTLLLLLEMTEGAAVGGCEVVMYIFPDVGHGEMMGVLV